MAFFSSPRIFDSFLMYSFFAASSAGKQTWYCILNKINWFSYVAENLSLFILTYISSTENYRKSIQVYLYMLYVVCSIHVPLLKSSILQSSL